MDIDWVRQYALTLSHTTETVQWGNDLVFKIGGKMYAVVALDPGDHWLSFKCTPEDFAELTERQGIVPAPHLARAFWVALESEHALGRTEIKNRVRAAYTIVLDRLPRKMRSALEVDGSLRGRRSASAIR